MLFYFFYYGLGKLNTCATWLTLHFKLNGTSKCTNISWFPEAKKIFSERKKIRTNQFNFSLLEQKKFFYAKKELNHGIWVIQFNCICDLFRILKNAFFKRFFSMWLKFLFSHTHFSDIWLKHKDNKLETSHFWLSSLLKLVESRYFLKKKSKMEINTKQTFFSNCRF